MEVKITQNRFLISHDNYCSPPAARLLGFDPPDIKSHQEEFADYFVGNKKMPGNSKLMQYFN